MQLTNDLEVDKEAPGGLSSNLTFVESRIFWLSRTQLQCPFARVTLVVDTKSAIFRVRVPSNCENVNVTVTNPRNLLIKIPRLHFVSLFIRLKSFS